MKSIGLSNFRCFANTGDIEIKPLTILVGKNASGKSSFLKVFPLLKQTIGRRHEGVYIWYDPNGVDFNNMANTVTHGKNSITINLTFDKVAFRTYFTKAKVKSLSSDVKIELRCCINKTGEERIEYFKLGLFGYEIRVNIKKENQVLFYVNDSRVNMKDEVRFVKTDSLLPRFVFIQDLEKNGIINFSNPEDTMIQIEELLAKHGKNKSIPKLENSKWINWIPGGFDTIGHYLNISTMALKWREMAVRLYLINNINEIIDTLNRYLTLMAHSITYIGPLRVISARYNRESNLSIDEISPNGDNLAALLSSLSPSQLIAFKHWTSDNFGFEPHVSKHDGIIELSVKPKGCDRFYNLSDIGFGYTQLLPIIVGIWKAQQESGHKVLTNSLVVKNERIICIEQPELHIHPALQKQFVSLLISLIMNKESESRFKFVVETHSETIINTIGSAIRSKKLDSDKVSILLFEDLKDQEEIMEDHKTANVKMRKTMITQSSFDEKGYLSHWPYGFLN